MSQHDFNVANQGFPAFRTDMNNAFAALASNSSGATAPSTTYAYQWWYDTTTNILKMRNADNDAWISFATFNQTTDTFSMTITGAAIAGQLSLEDGSASLPALTNTGDANTGLFFPAEDSVAVSTGGTERARIDASGNFGLGVTPSAFGGGKAIEVGALGISLHGLNTVNTLYTSGVYYNGTNLIYTAASPVSYYQQASGQHRWFNAPTGTIGTSATFTQAMTLNESGDLFVAKTTAGAATVGIEARAIGLFSASRSGGSVGLFNRLTSDGTVVEIMQDTVTEGTISVSGTTVSYNGGHLSRWAQFPDNSRPELLKGTVMSNLDQMSSWDGEQNEQLNCVQVSAVEGDANVAGVFVAWDTLDDGYNDILLAMTGDMIIRIAAGTTVQRGDLLMSAGDGTAKPQDDDIIRAKTIAKVTSTHVSHSYDDGSYAVPCVLMAC